VPGDAVGGSKFALRQFFFDGIRLVPETSTIFTEMQWMESSNKTRINPIARHANQVNASASIVKKIPGSSESQGGGGL